MGYRGKTLEQDRARSLRAEGYTMLEIATQLAVSKSSVSLWTRDVEPLPRPRKSTARKRGAHPQHLARLAEIDALEAEGIARIGLLSNQAFLAAGAALYAGEGSKGDGRVVFANSDPQMVAFFCAWLRRFFPVDESRLRVTVYLHRGLDLHAAQSSGQRSPVCPYSSSARPTVQCPIPPSVARSMSTGVRTFATAARGLIEQSWVWSGRCYLAEPRAFRGSSIGRAIGC